MAEYESHRPSQRSSFLVLPGGAKEQKIAEADHKHRKEKKKKDEERIGPTAGPEADVVRKSIALPDAATQQRLS